jgi:hypothetical protein
VDEISNGELGRRLDDLKGIMQGLVGRPEYTAWQQDVIGQLAGLRRDIAEMRSDHADDIKTVNTRITDVKNEARDNRMSWRTLIWTGLVPALVVVLGIVAQLWMNGGHR